MANYYEKARTNYFKVKDAAAFTEFLSKFSYGVEIVPHEKTGECALLFDEESGVPSFYYDENDEEVEIDFMEELSKHLTDNSIAVLVAVGSEKYRYLSGYAIAINSKGEIVSIGLGDIYSKAKAAFGEQVEISRAEY